MGRTENTASKISSVACVFISMGTRLRSRCVASAFTSGSTILTFRFLFIYFVFLLNYIALKQNRGHTTAYATRLKVVGLIPDEVTEFFFN
jgi:hypothetical protein